MLYDYRRFSIQLPEEQKLSGKSPLDYKYWLRWVAIIPVMLISQFAAMTLLHFWLMFIMSDSSFRLLLVSVMPQAVGFFAGLSAAQAVAPSHKKIAVFVSSTIFLLIIGMQLNNDLASNATGIAVWGAVIGALIGTCGAAYMALIKDEELIS
mgnify:CR=1 FL=1